MASCSGPRELHHSAAAAPLIKFTTWTRPKVHPVEELSNLPCLNAPRWPQSQTKARHRQKVKSLCYVGLWVGTLRLPTLSWGSSSYTWFVDQELALGCDDSQNTRNSGSPSQSSEDN